MAFDSISMMTCTTSGPLFIVTLLLSAATASVPVQFWRKKTTVLGGIVRMRSGTITGYEGEPGLHIYKEIPLLRLRSAIWGGVRLSSFTLRRKPLKIHRKNSAHELATQATEGGLVTASRATQEAKKM